MSNHFNPTYHIPVLLDECIEGLNINPDGVYADLTFGGGSHSAAILNKLSDKGRLFAFDKDKDALNNAIDDERFCLINDDYANITKQLRLYRVMQLDGVLADLGISSHQIDTSQRGFSFRTDAPLDLRLAPSGSFTAADIINSYEEQDLAEMFFNYAQISNARKLAKTLCRHREQQPIVTTGDLCGILRQLTAKNTENKYFAKVFQALRIEVNHELDSLNAMLEQIPSLLAPKGRLVVISYHSLEDKAVKNLIRSGNVKGELEKDFYGNVNTPFDIITKKPIVPTTQEQTMNPRSRSAKLRIAEKRQ